MSRKRGISRSTKCSQADSEFSAPKMSNSFKRTLGSVTHSCSHTEFSITQLTLPMMIVGIYLRSRGGPCPRPSHNTALVWIHMLAANFHPPTFFSVHPSTLSITVIAKENVAFGTAASRTNAYGRMLPLRPFLSEMWSTCATLMISFSEHSHSCRDNAMSCHSNIPSNLSLPSTFRLS